MTFFIIMFVFALLAISTLFGVKYWELKHERVLAPNLRDRADVRANQLKELLIAARLDLEKLPPMLVRLGRLLIRDGALAFAQLARLAERSAHDIADLVSYKHRFEKRETRSEFLKKVSEHRNGNDAGPDTANGNAQNESASHTTSSFGKEENI